MKWDDFSKENSLLYTLFIALFRFLFSKKLLNVCMKKFVVKRNRTNLILFITLIIVFNLRPLFLYIFNVCVYFVFVLLVKLSKKSSSASSSVSIYFYLQTSYFQQTVLPQKKSFLHSINYFEITNHQLWKIGSLFSFFLSCCLFSTSSFLATV